MLANSSGGVPKVIEPICTFSAPATPWTTPPLHSEFDLGHRVSAKAVGFHLLNQLVQCP